VRDRKKPDWVVIWVSLSGAVALLLVVIGANWLAYHPEITGPPCRSRISRYGGAPFC